MVELLPCPFCGGTDLLVEAMGITCRRCHAQVLGAGSTSDADTWNTRATTPTASELVEALRNIREKASQGMSHGLTADATCEDIMRLADAPLSREGVKP